MIESTLRSELLYDTGLTSIVGDRISAMIANQGETRPYITYQLVSANRNPTLCGATDLRIARMQINCFSLSYGQAKQMAEYVLDIIDNSLVLGSVFNGEQDAYDSDTKLYYVVIDYSLHQAD